MALLKVTPTRTSSNEGTTPSTLFGSSSKTTSGSKGQNKIASSMPIKEISFCRVLLRNCHVCLYENQTSKRFNLEPPSLENYFSYY